MTIRGRRKVKPVPLTEKEAAAYRRIIASLSGTWTIGDTAGEASYRTMHPELSLASGIGQAVYRSYSDEMLLEILTNTAKLLGRAPVQSEVFYLYRTYLKTRFHTWPAALRAAGMRQMPAPDLSMPDWAQILAEEPEICGALEAVAQHRHRLGYPPCKRDVPQAKALCDRFRSWENVIAAAKSFEKWQEGGNSVNK